MIEKTPSYKTSDGQTFIGLGEAQMHEIGTLFTEGQPFKRDEIATLIVQNGPFVIDVLTTTPKSKPRARRVNGGTKKRKAPPAPEKEQS